MESEGQKMQRIKLTTERIRRMDFTAMSDGRAQAFVWDSVAPRLGLRITAGSKAFIFESKLNRSTIRRTIGSAEVWTIDDARREATRLQVLIDQGLDPRELDAEDKAQKAAQKAAEAARRAEADHRQQYTLEALCRAYEAFLIARGKTKSAASARSGFNLHLIEAFPALAKTPANEVKPEQLVEAIRKLFHAGKERTAGVLRSNLSAAFTAAMRAPYSAKLPAEFIPFNVTTNPVALIDAIPVKARDRVLDEKELRAYLQALGEGQIDQILKIALFAGGQRLAQLMRARVRNYDAKTKTLTLFDGKGRRAEAREHVLPLGPVAAALVEAQVAIAKSRLTEYPDGWLFSETGKAPFDNLVPGKRLKKIVESIGCEKFDLRDIRRTAETAFAAMGVSQEIRAQIQSHGITGVQAKHYDRHSYLAEKRTALESWEAHLSKLQKKKTARKGGKQ